MYVNGQYVDEDRYVDDYQRRYDPQWDDEDDVEDDFTEWDQADMEVDERILGCTERR